jgi:filamentous hemagglutinin family protein
MVAGANSIKVGVFMKSGILSLCFWSSIFLGYFVKVSPTFAQIIPDSKLPTPTKVNTSGNVSEISEGTQVGSNLFHSFSDFSVKPGNTALFINNDTTIQNIISRVTGSSPSEIFGQIRSGGSETKFNLFLINPNGIIFGPQSSLNLNGSFVATTASAIQFGNQGFFDAFGINNDPSLLSVNPSAFFFSQVRSQPIINQARLIVPTNNSLILLGGNVDVYGGTSTLQIGFSAPSGRVELGGVEGVGSVLLNMNGGIFKLVFPDNVERANVSLNNTRVDVTGTGVGSIAINSRNINFERSSLTAGIRRGVEAGSITPGEIILDATQSINLNRSSIDNFTNVLGIGNSGSILINAGSLNLNNVSTILTRSFGKGNAGNVILNVLNGINLSGFTDTGVSTIGSGIQGGGEGKSGNIIVSSGSLYMADGSAIRNFVFGRGDTGDISIKVNDFVVLEKNTPLFSTQIRTVVEPGAVGNAGNIDIHARTLSLTGGGQLSAAVLGPDINQDLPGGRGKGGNISVTADSVIISGIGADSFQSGIFADTELGANGPAGNVAITTNFLKIDDGAEIKLSNPQGQAGNLTVNANRFTLNNGKITAETGGDGSSNGANINLKISDLLRLENESSISARASGNADGGNITIDTPILLALPPTGPNGSDIVASAEFGKGGNITINAKGVFGITERKVGNLTNDIDASSLFGRSGQVEINTATNPNNGLTELPETVVDPDYQVAQSPCNRGWGNELTVSGRGGLPPSPSQDLSSEATQVKLVEPVQASNGTQNNPGTQEKTSVLNSVPEAIVPAQGWVYNDKGQVLLVAYNPTATGPQRLKSNPPGCPVP